MSSKSIAAYQANRISSGKPAQAASAQAIELRRQASAKRDRALKLLAESLELDAAALTLETK